MCGGARTLFTVSLIPAAGTAGLPPSPAAPPRWRRIGLAWGRDPRPARGLDPQCRRGTDLHQVAGSWGGQAALGEMAGGGTGKVSVAPELSPRFPVSAELVTVRSAPTSGSIRGGHGAEGLQAVHGHAP